MYKSLARKKFNNYGDFKELLQSPIPSPFCEIQLNSNFTLHNIREARLIAKFNLGLMLSVLKYPHTITLSSIDP